MGEGRWRDARRIAATGGTFVVSLATLAAAALVAGRHHAGALFVGDGADTAHLRALVARALPAVAGYVVLDSIGPSFAHQTIFGLGVPLRLPAALNFAELLGRRDPDRRGDRDARGASGCSGCGSASTWGCSCLVCGVLTYIGCLDWRAAAERAAKRAQGDSAVGRLAGRDGAAEVAAAAEEGGDAV